MRSGDLLLEYLCLRCIECLVPYLAEHSSKVRAGNYAHTICDVGESSSEVWQRSIVKVISMVLALDLIQRRIASPNDSHSAHRDTRAIPSGKPAAFPQRLQSTNGIWEGRLAISLDVNEQVQRLCAVCIVHAIVRWTLRQER